MGPGPGPGAPSVVPAPGAAGGPRPPVSMAPPVGMNTNTAQAPKTGRSMFLWEIHIII